MQNLNRGGTGLDAMRVAVIIPAFNEERSLPLVLESLGRVSLPYAPGGRPLRLVDVVVVDNASTDATALVAREAGATVLAEPRRGYGSACLRGIAHITQDPPDIVAFLDADFSDDPQLLAGIVAPIADGRADFVLGSRLLGQAEPGALLPQARYGNILSVALIRLLYGHRYTDLGPFRALSFRTLTQLNMRDTAYGWTAEMQVKALLARVRVMEIPVPYRRRVGTSKITGTISGTVKAGATILWTICRLRLKGASELTRARGSS